jgi:hypothetical protein
MVSAPPMLTAQEMRSEIIKNKIRSEGLTQRMIQVEADIVDLSGSISPVEHVHDAADITTGTKTSAFISDFSTAVDTILESEKGAANGIASLDGTGKVPSAQLPVYVDDVLEYANTAAFPGTGTDGIIYVALDTGFSYRWSGTVYTRINTGDVASVFGRTGAITATSGDYTTAQVTESTNKKYVTDAQLAIINATSGTNTGDQTDITGNAGTVTTINGRIAAGTNVSLSGTGTAASPYTISATGGSSTNSFNTISVSGQSDVVADSSTDTLTLVAGTGISLTTNATTDSITITNTSSSSGGTTLDGYYISTCSSASTPEANMTAFIADCNAAKAAGLTLLMPNEKVLIGQTSQAVINIGEGECLHIAGYGPNSKLALANRYVGSSGEAALVFSTDPAHSGNATDYTISSITNAKYTSTDAVIGYTTKITLSSTPTGIKPGTMISVFATKRITYRYDAADFDNNEFNWTREMAQVTHVDGANLYLSTPLFYPATDYNSAVYKKIRVYPNCGLKFSNITITTSTDPRNQNCGDTDADNTAYTGVITATTPSIATGSKTFSVSTGKSWVAGETLVVVSNSNRSYFKGTVTSYNSSTGSLVLSVTTVNPTSGGTTFSSGYVERVVSRNSFIARVVGIPNVEIDDSVIIDGAWGGTFNFNSTIGAIYKPRHYNLINILPGNSNVLGYAPAWDGANLNPEASNDVKYGGRHNNTTVWLEEGTLSLTPTSLSTSTTLSYTTTGNTPASGDYIYVDFSPITGMSSATGVYLITAKSGSSITINLNSTSLSNTGGTAIATLFQTDVLYRYGHTYGGKFLGGASINTTGAMLDPHENAVNCVWGDVTINNGVGRTWANTAKRPCNSRGLNDTFVNVISTNHETFSSLDAFARQFGYPNTTTFRNCISLGVANFDSNDSTQTSTSPYITGPALFQMVGDTTVTDTRKLIVENFQMSGGTKRLLHFGSSSEGDGSASHIEFIGLKFDGDLNLHNSGTTPAASSVPFISARDANILIKDSVFDFKGVTRTTVIKFLEFFSIAAASAKVTIENCQFLNIPVASSVTLGFFEINYANSELKLINNTFHFVSTGGTSGRFIEVGATGAKISLIGNTFLGLANVNRVIYVADTATASVIEQGNSYDNTRRFLTTGTGALYLQSDYDPVYGTTSTTAVTTEETLQTRIFPVDTFTKLNRRVKFTIWGTTANNANTKTLRVKFGSTTIFSRTMTTSAANNWSIEGYVFETGTNAQTYVITSAWDGSTQVTPSRGTSTQTTSSTITFSVTGQNGTANAGDISCNGMILEVV